MDVNLKALFHSEGGTPKLAAEARSILATISLRLASERFDQGKEKSRSWSRLGLHGLSA